jgi:hypothetical protein
LAVAGVVTVAAALWAAYDGASGAFAWATLAYTLLTDGALIAVWFAGALGYGRRISDRLLGSTHRCIPSQVALGAGAVMLGVWLLGWAGLLGLVTSWLIIVVGLVLLLMDLKRRPARMGHVSGSLWMAGPTAGLLIAAATAAPGGLWRVPASGHAPQQRIAVSYDVLSYHLQLPREWYEAGAIRGLEHNVYSYLPSGLEATFTQLMHMRGGAIAAASACQLLHAGFALFAAFCIGQLVVSLAKRAELGNHVAMASGAVAGAAYLAAPWTIVTGSMAFTEQAANAFGAAALLVALHPGEPRPSGRGLAAGALVAMAAFAKLTSIGMFGVPVAFVLVWGAHTGRKRALTCFALGAFLPLALFMVRNWIWTGNPAFPLLAGALGTGHWTTEQAGRWQNAHSPMLDIATRFDRLVYMFAIHPYHGLVIWPAAIAGSIIAMCTHHMRRVGLMLLIAGVLQLLFWLGPTHLQSRFLVPVLVPACVLIGLGMARARQPIAIMAIGVALVGWLSWLGHSEYRQQTVGGISPSAFIGMADAMPRGSQPAGMLNELPGDVRIYAEGFATPFYVQRPMTYHTVWDTSPLGQLIDQHGVAGAITQLRTSGYTHLLIDQQMLGIWWSPGNYGYDPKFGPEHLRAIAELGLRRIQSAGSDVYLLYALNPSGGD